jgi:16S rRNA (cytidine1402-2'-O)-methyltransferase
MQEIFGERQIVVARELTKIYEEFIRGTVSEVLTTISLGKVRGEVVILITPGEIHREEPELLEDSVRRLLDEEGLSVKDAARKAAEITGVSRNEAYAMALNLRNGGDMS